MIADLNGKIISKKILSDSNVTHKFSRENDNGGDKQKAVVIKFIFTGDKDESIRAGEDWIWQARWRVAKCKVW